jgi:uncharacterized protein (DUF1330 family)
VFPIFDGFSGNSGSTQCAPQIAHPARQQKELSMASAYIVFIRERSVDGDALARYSALVPPTFAGRNVNFHVAYGRQEVLEGPEADGVVVLEFESWDEARRWYDSPEYQAAIPVRQGGATFRAILVEGTA